MLVIAVTAAWSALQPVRSVNATDAAQARVSSAARSAAAASIARIAHDRNPLSVDPLFQLAAIEASAGNLPPAKAALEQAVELEPANPETWRQLGRLRLDHLNDPRGALRAFQYAYYLDPQSAQSINDVVVTARIVAAARPLGAHGPGHQERAVTADRRFEPGERRARSRATGA